MRRIERSKIIVENRQRKGEQRSFRSKELKESISSRGLLHPIVLLKLADDKGYRLVCGGRRLTNIDWLFEEGASFVCDKEVFEAAQGEIPATLLMEDLVDHEIALTELEENINREDLVWQDRAEALARIFELAQKKDPKITAPKAAAMLKEETGTHLSIERLRIKMLESIKIQEHIHDPMIRHARTANEAYSLALKKEETNLRALMIKQRKSMYIGIKLIEGDCLAILPTLEASSIDLIITDPPYGINAGSDGAKSRTIYHHDYDDSPENARRITTAAIVEGFRLAKPRSNLFIFCDISLWSFLQQQAAAAGWVPFRTPIIWAKSDSEGLAPWGSSGFRRVYDFIFYATKGQRGLVSSPVDILRHARVGKAERDYAAAKPVSLLRELIECSTMIGETILDPCCGSGNVLIAAKESKRAAVGIEKDKNACNLATAKLEGAKLEAKLEGEPQNAAAADL